MNNSPIDQKNPTTLTSADQRCGLETSSSGQTKINDLDIFQLLRDLLATGSPQLYRRLMHEVDRAVVQETMRHVGGNQVLASKLLGMSRTTFRAKLKQVSVSRTASILETGTGADTSATLVALSDGEVSGDVGPTTEEERIPFCQDSETGSREPGTPLGARREK
jgi:DNA-binding protein Fis